MSAFRRLALILALLGAPQGAGIAGRTPAGYDRPGSMEGGAMPQDYPDLDMGRETGVEPARFRIAGRNVVVVGAVIDGAEAYFDNGVLQSKSKVEAGVTR